MTHVVVHVSVKALQYKKTRVVSLEIYNFITKSEVSAIMNCFIILLKPIVENPSGKKYVQVLI